MEDEGLRTTVSEDDLLHEMKRRRCELEDGFANLSLENVDMDTTIDDDPLDPASSNVEYESPSKPKDCDSSIPRLSHCYQPDEQSQAEVAQDKVVLDDSEGDVSPSFIVSPTLLKMLKTASPIKLPARENTNTALVLYRPILFPSTSNSAEDSDIEPVKVNNNCMSQNEDQGHESDDAMDIEF